MPDESPNVCRSNAPSSLEFALANTRAGAAAIRRGGGIFATTELAAEIEALRRHAIEEGIIGPFERLNESHDTFGYEHRVWFPGTNEPHPRVWKATFGNCFGTIPNGSLATPALYLERLILQNLVFGDDIRLEGIQEHPVGVISVITSQSAVKGKPGDMSAIHDYFLACGFVHLSWNGKPVWFRPSDHVVCADTHGGNILNVGGQMLVAIDVPAMSLAGKDLPDEIALVCNTAAYQIGNTMTEDDPALKDLVGRILKGDRDAEEQLFRIAWSWLKAWGINRFNVRPSDVEDFAVEVLTKALANLHRYYAWRSGFKTWLYTVAHNHARDRMRRAKSDILRGDWVELQTWMQTADVSHEASTLSGRAAEIEAVMLTLDERDNDLLSLALGTDATADEIAGKLGMTAGQVRTRKHRLLKHLCNLLSNPKDSTP